MKTLNNLKFMAMALFVAMLGLSLTACSDDDDDNGSGNDASSIVGVWTDDDGEVIITFRNDGTGYIEDEAGTNNFKYTYSYDSSKATGSLRITYISSSYINNYTVTITGSTMMWSTGTGTTYIWKKK